MKRAWQNWMKITATLSCHRVKKVPHELMNEIKIMQRAGATAKRPKTILMKEMRKRV